MTSLKKKPWIPHYGPDFDRKIWNPGDYKKDFDEENIKERDETRFYREKWRQENKDKKCKNCNEFYNTKIRKRKDEINSPTIFIKNKQERKNKKKSN